MANALNIAGCSHIYVAHRWTTRQWADGKSKELWATKGLAEIREMVKRNEYARMFIAAIPAGTGKDKTYASLEDALKKMGAYVVENTKSAHNNHGINIWVIPGLHHGKIHRANPKLIEKKKTNLYQQKALAKKRGKRR